MIRLLSDAVLRVQRRRLASAARRSKPVALAAVVLWLAAPVLIWRAGSPVGELLAGDVAALPLARGAALGLALGAAAAGAAIGVALPGRRALGAQIAAAPVPSASAVAVLALPVVGGAAILAGPALATLAAAVAVPSAGGPGAAVSLGLAAAAGATGGAATAEAALHACRRVVRPWEWVVAVAAGATAFAVAIEGPARALAYGGVTLVSSAVACGLAAAGAGWAWVRLAAVRPEPSASTGPRRARVRDRRPAATALLAAVALLSRPADLRAALVAAACFGLVGLGAGLAAGAPVAAALLLGGGACVVSAALVPLSVRGRLDPGGWVWRAGDPALVAGSWAAASLALVALALLPASVAALVRPSDAGVAVAQIAAVAIAGWSAALAAGALVPRRAQGAGDDALSLGAFAVASVTLGSAATVTGPLLGRVGVPDGLAVLALIVAAAAGAVTLLGSSRRSG